MCVCESDNISARQLKEVGKSKTVIGGEKRLSIEKREVEKGERGRGEEAGTGVAEGRKEKKVLFPGWE